MSHRPDRIDCRGSVDCSVGDKLSDWAQLADRWWSSQRGSSSVVMILGGSTRWSISVHRAGHLSLPQHVRPLSSASSWILNAANCPPPHIDRPTRRLQPPHRISVFTQPASAPGALLDNARPFRRRFSRVRLYRKYFALKCQVVFTHLKFYIVSNEADVNMAKCRLVSLHLPSMR